jgi:hypothetical protein
MRLGVKLLSGKQEAYLKSLTPVHAADIKHPSPQHS